MGYTHYWKFRKNDAAIFRMASVQFKAALEYLPKKVRLYGDPDGDETEIVLKGSWGDGDPVITDKAICFNGDADKGLEHETFSITAGDENGGFNFCKTARKPYSCAVCLALLVFKHLFGDDISVSSDGSMIDETYTDPDGGTHNFKTDYDWAVAKRAYDDFLAAHGCNKPDWDRILKGDDAYGA